jgi:hypothetical protein
MQLDTRTLAAVRAWLRPPLTRTRVVLAVAAAVVADGLQILLGPLGWPFADEAIDVVAMMATSSLIGAHVLLLPTFILEAVPVVGMLPTWTGCVIAVVAIRRRTRRATDP